jgi:hypothetical protein
MLVRHHPGIADLAEMLATEGPRDLKRRRGEVSDRRSRDLRVDGARWTEIGAGGTLVSFVLPRGSNPPDVF